MADIPSQFTFEELLSHTFPGLFSAISLFILIDLLSPIDLVSWAIKDVTSLISFAGLVLIFGTISGLIIDGISNSIIQDHFFKSLSELKYINRKYKLLRVINSNRPSEDLKRQYYFKKIGDKAMDMDKYLSNGYYRYSEFYSNIFISLIPFSLIIPFYLYYTLYMPWAESVILGLIPLILASLCLYSSYKAYCAYQNAVYSLIAGYLDAPSATMDEISIISSLKESKPDGKPKLIEGSLTVSAKIVKNK